jgi:oligoendopeptidase F
LSGCFREVEAFEEKFSNITLYSSLTFAADMTQQQAQALNDRVDKLNAKISKQLAFYSLELGKVIKTKPQLIDDPTLANYRHMLQRVLRRVEHQLSEVEEQLIIEKDQFM